MTELTMFERLQRSAKDEPAPVGAVMSAYADRKPYVPQAQDTPRPRGVQPTEPTMKNEPASPSLRALYEEQLARYGAMPKLAAAVQQTCAPAPRSPDADAIMALPEAKHSKLKRACEALANHPNITLDTARDLLATSAADLGIGPLDIEMADPANKARVPFSATSQPKPSGDAFDAGVASAYSSMIQRVKGTRQ